MRLGTKDGTLPDAFLGLREHEPLETLDDRLS